MCCWCGDALLMFWERAVGGLIDRPSKNLEHVYKIIFLGVLRRLMVTNEKPRTHTMELQKMP